MAAVAQSAECHEIVRQRIAASGLAGARANLPHYAALQRAFGSFDISGVTAQVGGPAALAAAELRAVAYTHGNRVGFARQPDLHTAAHEVTHVVQQRAGRGTRNTPAAGKTGEPSRGSAIFLVSSGEQELTRTKTFTPELTQALLAEDAGAFDDVLRRMADSVQRDDEDHFAAHPDIAYMGQLTAGIDEARTPNRSATMVANYLYYGISSVNTLPEALDLEGALTSKGFQTNLERNLNAPAMEAHYQGPINAAQAGDQLIVTYIGHGQSYYLLGVDEGYDPDSGLTRRSKRDRLSYNKLINPVRAAIDRGAHVRLIITACQSGKLAAAVRRDVLKDLKTRATSVEARDLLAAAKQVQQLRTDLLIMQDDAREAYDSLDESRKNLRMLIKSSEDSDAKGELQRRLDLVRQRMDGHDDQSVRELADFWLAQRPGVVALATMITMRTGQTPIAIPTELGSQRLPDRSDPRLTLGAVLDALGAVQNGLLAAAQAVLV